MKIMTLAYDYDVNNKQAEYELLLFVDLNPVKTKKVLHCIVDIKQGHVCSK